MFSFWKQGSAVTFWKQGSALLVFCTRLLYLVFEQGSALTFTLKPMEKD